MIGFSSLFKDDIEQGDYSNLEIYAKQLNLTANSGYELLENLLEWSKSQQGKLNFNPEMLVLEDIYNEVIALLEEKAKSKQLLLTMNVQEGIKIYGDSIMIQLIIRNLLGNAIKFSYPGTEIIFAHSEVDDFDIISIQDSGCGIDDNVKKYLFKLDSNYTSLGTNNEKGSGLGLFLAKEFVEQHHGELWFESILGKGSTFYIKLPKSKLS